MFTIVLKETGETPVTLQNYKEVLEHATKEEAARICRIIKRIWNIKVRL